MAYDPQNWSNDDPTTPLSAARLNYLESGVEAAAADADDAAAAVVTHEAAVDPHGDRAYTNTRIATLVGASPTALDTLAEIDAQLASDEAGAAAMLASIQANTTALGTKAAQADLLAHVNASSGAHAASAVSVNPSGLAVVTGGTVQAAVAQLDAWAAARPRSGDGHLSQLPLDSDASWPNDSTFYVDDQFGGVTYRKVAGHWTQQGAGVTQGGGGLAAGPVLLSQSFDVKAVGVTITDIPGMSLNIPASPTRGIIVRCRLSAFMSLGTFPSGSTQGIWLLLTDAANNNLFMDAQYVVATGANVTQLNRLVIECYLPPPVTAITLKLRTRTAVAVGAAGTISILPGYGVVTQSEPFYAQYAA